jgi:hypothetical protein
MSDHPSEFDNSPLETDTWVAGSYMFDNAFASPLMISRWSFTRMAQNASINQYQHSWLIFIGLVVMISACQE